jgi:hypothetical protein
LVKEGIARVEARTLVTPYWGHKLERMLVGLLPRGLVEGIARRRMKEVMDARERKNKRTD